MGFIPQSMDARSAAAMAATIAPVCHVSPAAPAHAAALNGGAGGRGASAAPLQGRLPSAVAAQVLTAYAHAAASGGVAAAAGGGMWGASPHLAALASEAGGPPGAGAPRPPPHLFVRGSLHFTHRPGAHARAVYAVSSIRNDEETLALGPNPFAATVPPSKAPPPPPPRLAWHLPPAPPGHAAAPVPAGRAIPLSALQRLPAPAAAALSPRQQARHHAGGGVGSPLAQSLRQLGLADALLPHRARQARQQLAQQQQQQLLGVAAIALASGPAEAAGQGSAGYPHGGGANPRSGPAQSRTEHGQCYYSAMTR